MHARRASAPQDAELGATYHGAELRAMSPSRQSIIVTFVATTIDLDATDLGAETCSLGAMVHGTELRVYFPKSFQKRHICEILSPKGPKGKKVGQMNCIKMDYGIMFLRWTL
jgi:hypothetical protein